MQYKIFFVASIITLSAFTGTAQSRGGRVPDMKVVKTDSIVIRRADPNYCPPSACPPVVAAAPLPKVKKAVPLAGQADYYGEKNNYVQEFVRKYLSAHNKTLNVVQGRSTPHFSLIDNVLTQHDIPKELKYLAVIESALNNKAISRAGAVGPWQLMGPTARLMGITVNKKRDDRKDWYQSTTAAAKYLNLLYSSLNDWLLVVAAYNSGPGPVRRAMDKTGSNNFWDIKPYLPKETQGHVLAFIATATIFENLSNFIGLGNIPADLKMDGKKFEMAAKTAAVVTDKKAPPKIVFSQEEISNMAIVKLSEPLSMDLMAQVLSVERSLLTRWNPDYELYEYKAYGTPDYKLRIPKDKLDNFVEKKDFMTKRSRQILANVTL